MVFTQCSPHPHFSVCCILVIKDSSIQNLLLLIFLQEISIIKFNKQTSMKQGSKFSKKPNNQTRNVIFFCDKKYTDKLISTYYLCGFF